MKAKFLIPLALFGVLVAFLAVGLQRAQVAPLVGPDYKDTRPAVLKYLAQDGDPYDLAAYDGDGRVGIDYGVYGVSETFIVDKNGVIRHKQIGPITPEALKKAILPLLDRLKKES